MSDLERTFATLIGLWILAILVLVLVVSVTWDRALHWLVGVGFWFLLATPLMVRTVRWLADRDPAE